MTGSLVFRIEPYCVTDLKAFEEMLKHPSRRMNQHKDAEPEELIWRVHDAIDHFVDGAEQFDNITMLCLKYTGEKNPKDQTSWKSLALKS